MGWAPGFTNHLCHHLLSNRIPQSVRILGSLVAILLVFLITAILVKVPLHALSFFVITMIKIMLINCKRGWVGTWAEVPWLVREETSSLCVVRIQEPEQGRTRAGRQGPGSGKKRGCSASGLTGSQAGLAEAPRPTQLPSPAVHLVAQLSAPSCRAACLAWLASCLPATQPPS